MSPDTRDLFIAALVFVILGVGFAVLKREVDRRDFNLKRLEYTQPMDKQGLACMLDKWECLPLSHNIDDRR